MRLEEGIALVKTKLQNFRMEDGTDCSRWFQRLKTQLGSRMTRANVLGYSVLLNQTPLQDIKARDTQRLWYTLWHGTACLWGLYVLYWEAGTPEVPGWPRLHMGQPDGRWYWMASPEELSRGSGGWPLLVPSVPARNYYLCQLAFWITCLVFMNLETRRRDFGLFLLHHVLTITLVGLSYCCSYWKLGTSVLLLHDMADFFLYLSKMLHYSRVKSGPVEIAFATFTIVFFVARLVLYPLYCVRPCLNTALIKEFTRDFVDSRWHIPGGTVLPGFLVVLQVLHIYWFYCIIRMIIGLVRAIRKGSREDCEDIRSEDGSDDETNEDAKKIQ
ncbi:longevity-assurance protein domain-containing protein [Cyclospora cayetanensis]|uniref:Longevity-assurance protein domain-containing protein n=1 Tax=Cyclospora cayetanensis TaxID=88456 RepID=A0A1D3CU91_9EIME|nr:longevity-assurance protein domain-containing protein [Cyclospora cayetanensis]